MEDPTTLQLASAALVVCMGSAVQSSVGFGLALSSAPLLLLIYPRLVPGPLICAGLMLTLLVAARERESLRVAWIGWALVGRLPGVGIGAATLLILSRESLHVMIGALVILAVLLSAVGPHIRPNRRTLFAAGMLSGFMGITSSIGGPPVAMLYQHETGPTLRATLSGYFVVGTTMTLIVLAAIGHFGWRELSWGFALMPGTLVGFSVSFFTRRWLDAGRTRKAVLVLAAATGLLVVATELF